MWLRALTVWKGVLYVIRADITARHRESAAKVCTFEKGKLPNITCDITNSLNIFVFGLVSMAI